MDCLNPNCNGKIAIIENPVRKTKYVGCSLYPNNCDYWNGGPYPDSLNDIKYIKKCPECRGILVRHGDILKCCLDYSEWCSVTEELKLNKKDLEFDYE